MAELVTMETYASWSPQARTEFDLWLRLTTGLEVGSVQVFEVIITDRLIITSHWLKWEGGIFAATDEDGKPYWFAQTFDRQLGQWKQSPPILLRSET